MVRAVLVIIAAAQLALLLAAELVLAKDIKGTKSPTPAVVTSGGFAPEGSVCTFPFKTLTAKAKKKVTHTACVSFNSNPPFVNESMRTPDGLQPDVATWCFTGVPNTVYTRTSAVKAEWGFCQGFVSVQSGPTQQPTNQPSLRPAPPIVGTRIVVATKLEVLLANCNHASEPFTASIDGTGVALNFSDTPCSCYPGVRSAWVDPSLFISPGSHTFRFGTSSMLAWVRLEVEIDTGVKLWVALYDFSASQGGPNLALRNDTDLCDGYGMFARPPRSCARAESSRLARGLKTARACYSPAHCAKSSLTWLRLALKRPRPRRRPRRRCPS